MKQINIKVNHLEKKENPVFLQGRTVTYISQYLRNLGIAENDLESFLNEPRPDDKDKPLNLDNIEEAVKTAYAAFTEPNAHLFVQVDSDTDGYTSSSILINYLKIRFPELKITYALHPGKEHGVDLSSVPEDTTIVIIPDAGSNQFEEQATLAAQGKKVIILDHHEVSHMEMLEKTPAIIVNNQISSRFPNKFLSGAGIVYMFITLFDEIYFGDDVQIADNYMDLTAIGIIADSMDMTTLGNNYIAFYGLQNIHNKFIQALAEKQSRGIKNPTHLTKIDVAFYLAPVINGVIRGGSPEDKKAVFEALITNNDDTLYPHIFRGNTTYETLWDQAVRLAVNAKSRQDSAKKKSFEWLSEKIRQEGLDKDNLIIVTLNEKESLKVSPNVTGLIAMELVKEFNKPTLVLRKTTFKEEDADEIPVYGGSGRNGNFHCLPDLKKVLSDAGGFYQEG